MNIKKQGYMRMIIFSLALLIFFLLIEREVSARRYFAIYKPRMSYGFSFKYGKEERTSPGSDRESEHYDYFEHIRLRTRGFVYHPALIVYKLEYSPEWRQDIDMPNPDSKTRRNAFAHTYNAQVGILRDKPYSLNVSASRGVATSSSNLGRETRTTSDSYSSSLSLKSRELPTKIYYSQNETESSGFFSSNNEKKILGFQMQSESYLGKSRLLGSYNMLRSKLSTGITKTIENRMAFKNSYGIARNMSLGSNWSYRGFKDASNNHQRYQFRESVNWKHSRNLKTKYSFLYLLNKFRESESQSGVLGFKLSHSLYENLKTGINASASKTKVASDDITEYRGGLNLKYKRRIPWGSIGGKAIHNFRLRSKDGEERIAGVLGEPVTLQTGSITLLNNRNVDASSIEVFNDSRSTKFEIDRDYSITGDDSFVRISCVEGGLIDVTFDCIDGAQVIVDYAFSTNPSSDILTVSRVYGATVKLWDRLNVAYEVHLSNEEALSGEAKGSLRDDVTHNTRASLNWKWNQLNIGYTKRNAKSSPHESWYVNDAITARPNNRLYLRLRADYREITFTDRGDSEQVIGAGLNINIATTRNSILKFNGSWRSIMGSRQELEILGFSTEYLLEFRRVRIRLEAGNSYEESRTSDYTINRFHFLLKADTRI